MNEVEFGKCDFCKLDKPISRVYLKPSKYIKNKENKDYLKLYNEGNYFIIIRYCQDCGEPKV